MVLSFLSRTGGLKIFLLINQIDMIENIKKDNLNQTQGKEI